MCYSWALPLAILLGLVHAAFGDYHHCNPKGNCYTVYTTAMSFQKAVTTCGSNGTLATMKSQQEKSEILDFVTQLAYKRDITALWLGLHLPACVVKDKKLFGFAWITGGEDTQVSEWERIPKPTCTIKKRCVILTARRDNSDNVPKALDWFWRNVKCEKNYSLICRSNNTMPISTPKDLVTYSPTEQYSPHTPSTLQHTELSNSVSRISVLCKGFVGNVTVSCGMNISYVCNSTHCSCGHVYRGHYTIKQCQTITNESCLEQCIKGSNISCDCTDEQIPCQCSISIPDSSKLPVLPSTSVHYPSSSSPPMNEDENLLEQLIIPLILGLVAFGILIMLVWGGVQMCIRKKKPKRRKSIAPAPPEGDETDSTDHSSSDEDEDEEDEEEEPQDRTDNP